MKTKKLLKHFSFLLVLLTIMFRLTGQDAMLYVQAESLWLREQTVIDDLRSSGFSTLVIVGLNINKNGDLIAGTGWHGGGSVLLASDGNYVGGTNLLARKFARGVAQLKTAPTTISRLEFMIVPGGIIREVYEEGGEAAFGEESVFYKNFAALKEAIPGIEAFNNDDESSYHLSSTAALTKMLASLGYTNSIVPYTRAGYWKDLVNEVNSAYPGNIDRNYLQCYSGGRYINPCDSIWDLGIPVHPGRSFTDPTTTPLVARNKMAAWKNDCGSRLGGGFYWLYENSGRYSHTKTKPYADAINAVFPREEDKIEYTAPVVVNHHASWAASVHTADLDGDGDMDILSASEGDNKIAWSENLGGGAFRNHFISTEAAGARSVYAADLDGDRDLDVLSASAYDHKIAWYENLGRGNFGDRETNQQLINTDARAAYSVYAADLDNDGDMDVLSASASDDKIAWYENTGEEDNLFGYKEGNPSANQKVISSWAEGARSVYAADLDGDGDMDVLSASYTTNKIAWYINNRDGNFGQQTISTIASGASSVHAADLDGDEDMDVLSASITDNKIVWYENIGLTGFDRIFVPHIISTSAIYAQSVHTADLDGDGDLDVLSASAGDNKIAWYENLGGGDFVGSLSNNQKIISTAANGPLSVHAADLDNDGDLDVLSASYRDDKINAYYNMESPGRKIISAPADNSTSIHTADLDNDGYMDLLSASYLDDRISWYPNDGTGNFGEQRTVFSDVTSRDIYTGDLDGDGYPDIVSAEMRFPSGAGKIAWYRNNTDGSFGNRRIISDRVDHPESVHMADLDGDGDLDVLSASYRDNKIAWYKNPGDGDFGEQRIISTAALGARAVYTADLDGDGDQDVLSASWDDDTIAWYENLGGGDFGEPQNNLRSISTVADGALSVAVADLDRDGRPDVLSASFLDNKVAWYRNLGGGNFGGQQLISTMPQGPRSVYTADMDSDGRPDVLSASSWDNTIAWYRNEGAGSFGEQQIVSKTVAGALSVRAADMDRDGDPDILSISSPDGKIFLYPNTLERKLGIVSVSPPPNSTDTPENTNIEVHFSFPPDPGAINSESFRVSGEESGPAEGSFRISGSTVNFHPEQPFKAGERVNVAIMQGLRPHVYTWTFRAKTAVIGHELSFKGTRIGAEADGATSVHTADLDKDGDLDILSASFNDDKIAWYENDGAGHFGEQGIISTEADGATSIHTADLDKDGDLDVLSASFDDNTIAWYENDGLGHFGAQRIISTETDGARSVHTADLDCDGDLDVLSASFNDNKIAWYRNNTDGSFGEQLMISNEADGASCVHAGDLDGDGDLDVLSASADDDKIAWYENDGAGNFGAQRIISTEAGGAWAVHTGDLDGDGDLDVLSASYNDNKIAWYPSDGVGNFGAQRIISTEAEGASSVHVGDLDGDGDLDVLSASADDDKIAWYENDGAGNFGEQLMISTDAEGALSVHTGDLDGDGDLDVLSASTADNRIAWYMNNRLPTIVAGIPDQLMDGGFKTHNLELDGVFADGDGHALRFSAVPDKEAVVSVAVSEDGSQLLLTETGPGITDITLTADDGHGGVATDVFAVAVVTEGNRSPIVSREIPDQEFNEGFGTHTLDLGGVFEDADGHELTVTVASANAGVVTASLSGDGAQLHLTETGAGVTDIRVSAEDGHGGRAVEVFLVSVMVQGNHPPAVANPIADRQMNVGFGTHILDLDGLFTDPDGHELTVTVASANAGVVTASLSGQGSLLLTEEGTGVADITITARDNYGGMAVHTFKVRVVRAEDALAGDNFQLWAMGETCKGRDNGAIQISAAQELEYTATVKDKTHDFTKELKVTDLPPGPYPVCIAVKGSAYQQCFELMVAAAPVLSGKTSLGKGSGIPNKVSVEIASGTAPYTVMVNDRRIGQYDTNKFSVAVNQGDHVEILSSVACEGKLAVALPWSGGTTRAAPNPTGSDVEFTVPGAIKDRMTIDIHDVSGAKVSSKSYPVNNHKVVVGMEALPAGVYFVHLEEGSPRRFKIVKR
ncbi:FG-GAP-like repeat-containing protein [Flavobacteriaceae bacterium 3-367]